MNRNSKPDTVLLLERSGPDPFEQDLSQFDDHLADHTTYLSDEPSSRAAIVGAREISIVVDIGPEDEGTLLIHGEADGSPRTYQVLLEIVTGVLLVRCYEGAALAVEARVPELDSEAGPYLIHWSTHDVSASDVRSELMVYSLVANEVTHAQATHARATTSASYNLYIGGVAGSDTFDGGLAAFRAVRIGRRFHSTTEAREDWVAERTPPDAAALRRTAYLSPDRETLELAEQAEGAGPAHLWAGHAFRHADRRLLGPLLNLRIRAPKVITGAYAPPSWYRPAPDDDRYHLQIGHLFRRPVPRNCTHARVRIFLRQTQSVMPVTTHWRMYSLRGLPVAGQPDVQIAAVHSATIATSADHGSAAGEWYDLGVVALLTDADNLTWLALAHSIGLDDGAPDNLTVQCRIKAIVAEPLYFPPAPSGLDVEDF